MELPLLFVLIGTACLLLGGLTFKWMLIQDEKHAKKANNQQGNGCLGNLFIWLMIIGAILLIIGMMSSGPTGVGDPSYAPNWRGK